MQTIRSDNCMAGSNRISLAVFVVVLLLWAFQQDAVTQDRLAALEPDKATRTRLSKVVDGIVSAWDKFDVVCLGEGHGVKADSDLRIMVVQHPDFARKVNVIMVESADINRQDPFLGRHVSIQQGFGGF